MRRATTRFGIAGVAALAAVAVLAPVQAGAVEGDFAAEATGEQLFVDAVNFNSFTPDAPIDSLATIGVSPTQAQVASPDGLGGGVLSRGFGQNLDLSLLGTEVPLDLSTAEQTAPPDNDEPAVAELIPLHAAAPLLTGAVSRSTALANDPATVQCPDEGGRAVLSEGTSTTTDLGVLEVLDGASLISVTGEGDGTLRSSSATYVGPAGEVIAESQAQTAAVNIAGELVLEIVDPTLTAVAPGTPGDASVTYTGQVLLNGEELVGTHSQTLALTVLEPLLGPVDELLLNEVFGPLDEVLGQLGSALDGTPLGEILDFSALEDEVLTDLVQRSDLVIEDLAALLTPTIDISVAQLDSTTAADGTSASGAISVVRIDLTLFNTLLDTTEALLSVDLMPMSVAAEVPAGGLDCGGGPDDPLDEVHKDVSAARVRPGTTFDYAITVPNTDPSCTLTDVTVTDVVEGPGTIVATTPEGVVDGNTATWTIDSLPPNESRTFIVTVRVDDDATAGESFDDRVTVTGDCDGEEVDGGDTIDDIPTVTTDSLDGCDVSASNKSATHLEVMPGQTFSYLVHAYNAGDEDCGETVVADTLPAGVEFVSCTPACEQNGRDVLFTIDQLAAGQSVTLSITVQAPDERTNDLVNVATIAPANGSSTDVSTDIPDVTDRSVPAPPDPADFTGAPSVTPGENLPRTGGGLALAGLAALALAGRLRRRT